MDAKPVLFPTPYTEVNAALQDFAGRIRAILGRRFLGLYLYGSLALGDFNPDTSDLDFIVVTRGAILADRFSALAEMHAWFDRSDSPWARRIEAAYIPREALNHPTPTQAAYPQVEKGAELFRAPLEPGWVFQRYTLREHGVVVAGPVPRALVAPVDPAEMRQAAAAIAGEWLERSRRDPAWIAWARPRSHLSFVVLTLCRLLYSLETGAVCSKPAAARWVREHTGGRWEQLIQRALADQQDCREAPEPELQEMLALLGYTVEKCL